MRSCSHGEQFSNEHVWPSRAADVPRSASIKTETPVFGRRRPCQAHASRRKRWITSSTILVSKSWTPCTRKHPFAMLRSAPPKSYNRGRVRFQIPPPLLRVSPGRCSLVCLNSLHPWIQRIVGLPPFLALREAHRLMNHSPHSMDSRLSSIIRSLRLTFDTVSRALLAGLSIVARSVDVDQGSSSIQLSRSPVFTGSLKLSLSTGIGLIASELLSLPSGLHFRRLDLEWNRDDDIPSTVALVESCCHTLEDLRVRPNSELCASVRHLRPH